MNTAPPADCSHQMGSGLVFAQILIQGPALSPAGLWADFLLHSQKGCEKRETKCMATKWKCPFPEGNFLLTEDINYHHFLKKLIRCWVLLWESFWHGLGRNSWTWNQLHHLQTMFFSIEALYFFRTLHCALISPSLWSTQECLYGNKRCLIFLCLPLQGYFSPLTSILRYLPSYV